MLLVMNPEIRLILIIKFNKIRIPKHSEVINLYKKTSIAVVCSRWEEPFGRTSLEASANGCAVIISNKGDCQKQ